jgi:hypothetical protein
MENLPTKINIKGIYLIKDFFMEDGFKERLAKEFQTFRLKIHRSEREQVKAELNAFYLVCLDQIDNKDMILEVHLFMFELLNEYARKYNSVETLQNIISKIEKSGLKSELFGKHPYRSKYIYANTLFTLYDLKKIENKGDFSKENIEMLLKSKYYLLKIYSQFIDKKISINKNQLEACLVLLSGCLTQLSRWFDPIYYLNIAAKSQLTDNPNIDYVLALNLEALKEKTCLNYNGLLILKIIDKCNSVIKNSHGHVKQKSQLEELKKSCKLYLKESDQKITELRKHKNKTQKSFIKYNDYKKFCIENQLFLNEHSFFCNCDHSTRDNLKIKTNHGHTHMDWVKEFEDILDIISFDYINARHNYYKSLNNTKLDGYYNTGIKRSSTINNLKKSLLKNSFKLCYSILDQIAYGIIKALDVKYESILLSKYGEKSKIPKLYFLNMWDEPLFSDEQFNANFYLISLYSIAKDLDRTEYSALSDFKLIRNSMEHRILHITNDEINGKKYPDTYSKDELTRKTELLLILTKSCIYTFTNLIRRQSKLMEINSSIDCSIQKEHV